MTNKENRHNVSPESQAPGSALREAEWLDPRAYAVPPILNSVHIPVKQLPARTCELPRRNRLIPIADVGDEALAAWAWLDSAGRRARIVDGFRFGQSAPARLWQPNAFLEQCVPKFPRGRALDLACGAGRDAVFLASCGFEVMAIDHLPDAIAMGREMERRYLERSFPIEWVCADLDDFTPEGEFDVVTCFFHLNRALLRRIPEILAPGGHLIVETFSAQHRKQFGKPKSSDLVIDPDEILGLTQGLVMIHHEESSRDERHTVRFWAKSMSRF